MRPVFFCMVLAALKRPQGSRPAAFRASFLAFVPACRIQALSLVPAFPPSSCFSRLPPDVHDSQARGSRGGRAFLRHPVPHHKARVFLWVIFVLPLRYCSAMSIGPGPSRDGGTATVSRRVPRSCCCWRQLL